MKNIDENLLCFIMGIIMAAAFLAIVVGDGNKSIIDLL
jgi:hypothetical protein